MTDEKEPSTFDYLDSINQNKKDLMTDENESKYQPYLVNHFLSGTMDTLFYANEMNQAHFLDKRMQYDYLRLSVRPKFRRAKWYKAEKLEDVLLLQKYYGYNLKRAKEALKMHTKEQIQYIRDFYETGGA